MPNTCYIHMSQKETHHSNTHSVIKLQQRNAYDVMTNDYIRTSWQIEHVQMSVCVSVLFFGADLLTNNFDVL